MEVVSESQILKDGGALAEDGVAHEQGAVSGKDGRDRIDRVLGTLQDLELSVAGN